MDTASVKEQVIEVYNKLSSLRQKLITPYIYPEDEFVKQWENEKRIWKEKHVVGTEPEIEILTEKGERVRSKSEKILADKLYMMGVPYIYELPLHLQGHDYVRPDFTVLNKRTHREYYWEHLGMMDNPGYCDKAIRKIESYQRAGHFPGKDLLLTYETSIHPLNSKIAEGIITEYLL